ncbi:MAG: hypothetical protein ACK2UK_02905 [Candidatus Promineifilaceae bacterium]|jgi:hypothetical protein
MNTEQDHIKSIAQILAKTWQAHHDAFAHVDGTDPEWPLWYAEYSHADLAGLLPQELTISQLARRFAEMDKQFKTSSTPLNWTQYYARHLVEENQDW